jgi:hypothetical protein
MPNNHKDLKIDITKSLIPLSYQIEDIGMFIKSTT